MSSKRNLLPLTPPVEVSDEQPRRVNMLADEGTQMLDALGSDTARAILTALCEEPATTSEISERIGTSIQNVHHHLGQLQNADLVRVVTTHYSSRGLEMDVYAVKGAPLMLVCGNQEGINLMDSTDGRATDEQPLAATVDSD